MVTNRVVIGTAPDSWGIWFADDPNQTPADRFLDEVVQAGYEWIEIGAYGYLSTDPAKLRDGLSSRRLKSRAVQPSLAYNIPELSTRSGNVSHRLPP